MKTYEELLVHALTEWAQNLGEERARDALSCFVQDGVHNPDRRTWKESLLQDSVRKGSPADMADPDELAKATADALDWMLITDMSPVPEPRRRKRRD